MPEAEPLKAIREAIAENGDEFSGLINNPEFKKVFPEMMDDKLKTAPKGYSPDNEFIDLLRYKSFAFSSRITREEILSENYIEQLIRSFKILHPVNRFLNDALENNL